MYSKIFKDEDRWRADVECMQDATYCFSSQVNRSHVIDTNNGV